MSTTQTIIVTVTYACNFACSYCYNKSRSSEVMSIKTLTALIRSAFKFDATELHFIWIGGEPLIVGVDFFKKALVIQKKLSKDYNIKYKNLMQTNGSLIGKEWVDFLIANNFAVGFSLDGPETIHNKNRVYMNNCSTYFDSLKGFSLMRNRNKKTGILSVIDQNVFKYYKEYALWIKEIECNSISFNLRFSTLNSLSRAEVIRGYQDFLCGIDKECKLLNHKLVIRELIPKDDIEGCVSFCDNGILCAYNHCGVDLDGTIYFCCDRFVHSKNSMKNYAVGSVYGSGFRGVYGDTNFKNLVGEVYGTVKECRRKCGSNKNCIKVCPANILIDNITHNMFENDLCPNSIEFQKTLYNKAQNES